MYPNHGDAGSVYSGIMLDFDLDPIVRNDHRTGMDVAKAIIKHVNNDVPVLVHSMNPGGSNEATTALSGAEFHVVQTPFRKLKRSAFLDWLDDCYD